MVLASRCPYGEVVPTLRVRGRRGATGRDGSDPRRSPHPVPGADGADDRAVGRRAVRRGDELPAASRNSGSGARDRPHARGGRASRPGAWAAPCATRCCGNPHVGLRFRHLGHARAGAAPLSAAPSAVGIKYGTVGVLDRQRVLHEVTTFRRDVATDGRHAVVAYGVSLEDDLARRDFTINALAYHPAPARVAGSVRRRGRPRAPPGARGGRSGRSGSRRTTCGFSGRSGSRRGSASRSTREPGRRRRRPLRASPSSPPSGCGTSGSRVCAPRGRLGQLVRLWHEVGRRRVWMPELAPDASNRLVPEASAEERDPVLLTALSARRPGGGAAPAQGLQRRDRAGARRSSGARRRPAARTQVAVRRWLATVGRGRGGPDLARSGALRHGGPSRPGRRRWRRSARRGDPLTRVGSRHHGDDLQAARHPPGPRVGRDARRAARPGAGRPVAEHPGAAARARPGDRGDARSPSRLAAAWATWSGRSPWSVICGAGSGSSTPASPSAPASCWRVTRARRAARGARRASRGRRAATCWRATSRSTWPSTCSLPISISARRPTGSARAAGDSALLGLTLHTFFDGVAIASGFLVSGRLGILLFLAVLLHKLPEGVTIASVMVAGGARAARGPSVRRRCSGGATILGVLLDRAGGAAGAARAGAVRRGHPVRRGLESGARVPGQAGLAHAPGVLRRGGGILRDRAVLRWKIAWGWT